ncbi:MAG: two-component system response regulator [Elusimicrobia bacterium CG11_big_fil_rev_8_21_14_0_20_64_6]|nr:MAG: two-component system response regulator [Elusimicrobia bacterium CG11_big_fil_rev_8_21_14_0_20_64_6]
MKILVADDDATMLKIASLCLAKKGGHEVVCATDGAQAVSLAEANQPDAILLDGMMPVLDGPGALKKLRESEKTKNIPVIFLSAASDPAALELYRSLRPAGIIAKPFNPMTLSDQVLKILSGPPL